MVAVPTLIGSAWIAFPYLMSWNAGYQIWRASCTLGCLISGIGGVCWIAERNDGRNPSWFKIIALTLLYIGSLTAGTLGVFYWAFERGYFLD